MKPAAISSRATRLFRVVPPVAIASTGPDPTAANYSRANQSRLGGRTPRQFTGSLLLTVAIGLGAVSGPAASHPNWFKIVALTTNNAVFTEATLAGHLAASADHLFASRVGSSDFRRWDAEGLGNFTAYESGLIMVSDLRTEQLYVFAGADGPLSGSGTATALLGLDPVTAQTNGVVIALSASVSVEEGCSPEYGLFCGWGRVVVGRSQLFHIAIPSGEVTALGKANPFDQWCDPSEPLTGIAEFFGDELYLVACQPFSGGRFERVRLANGERTTVTAFSDLPRNTKLAFSPSRNRWYFSTESSWLGPAWEAIGYADAQWDQSDELPAPPPLTVTIPAEVVQLEDSTSTNLLGSFAQRENAGPTSIRVVASSNPSLLSTNSVTYAGGGFLGFDTAGTFQFVVNPLPNQFGIATLTFLTSNNIGESVTNYLTATVLPVNNDPPSIAITNATMKVFVPPPHVDSRPVRLTNHFRLTDPDLPATAPVFTFQTSDPWAVPTNNLAVLSDGTNYQLIAEVPPGRFSYDQRVWVTATDETGLTAHQTLTFHVLPTGIRAAGTFTGTDYRVYSLAGLRNWTATAPLNVTGLAGQVRQSWLYVHSAIMPTFPTLRGVNLNSPGRIAEVAGVATDSCESLHDSYLTRFDVTDLVHSNGVYTLGNLQEGGFSTEVVRTVNGVSLLVFYDDGDPSNNLDVALYHGNDSNEDGKTDPTGWQTLLSDLTYAGGPATLTLHVAYGELNLEPPIFINGNLWQATTNLFDGLSLPKVSDLAAAFWDVVEFDLSPRLSLGTNHLLFTSNRSTNTQDCLNLCLATVAQPAASVPAPRLTLRRIGAQQVEVSWAPLTPGFVLQESPSLSPPDWSNVASEGENPFLVPISVPTRFYRLFKP